MANDDDSRIIDPDGFFAGNAKENIRVIDPAGTEANGTDGSAGASDFARDSDGNIKRNKDGSPQRKRGRKAGSGSGARKPKSAKSPNDLKGLEKILLSIHLMAASATKMPLLAIDEKEAALMAGAIQSVQDFYDISASAEVMLWVNFIGVFGAIYGPRIVAGVAMKKEKAKDAKEKKEEKASSVIMEEGFTVPHHAPAQ